jgi:hypothetical protein
VHLHKVFVLVSVHKGSQLYYVLRDGRARVQKEVDLSLVGRGGETQLGFMFRLYKVLGKFLFVLVQSKERD